MARDLIVFGEDWGGLPSSTQHLIQHLSKDRKVLWVNSIGLRQPCFTAVDFKRVVRKIYRFGMSKINDVRGSRLPSSPRFQVINPVTIPAPKSKLARKLAAKLLGLQVLPKMQQMKLVNPVLWSSLPTASDVAKNLGQLPVIYYCGDDFSALEGVDHKVVDEHEQDLVAVSDLIITVSAALFDKFPKTKTKLLTHGVDLELFSSAVAVAPDLPVNGRPIAGFYGSLCEWLDQDLLIKVMQRYPDWNFVFIGEEKVDVRSLKKFPNAYFMGPRSHHDLARYSQHWDVSLLPFRLNDQIKACNPLKLKEYMATGKPIISTDFPAVRAYSQEIDIAKNAEAFGDFIGRYPELSLQSKSQRIRSVEKESWSHKASMLSQWVEAL